jgi:hypothetical protein
MSQVGTGAIEIHGLCRYASIRERNDEDRNISPTKGGDILFSTHVGYRALGFLDDWQSHSNSNQYLCMQLGKWNSNAIIRPCLPGEFQTSRIYGLTLQQEGSEIRRRGLFYIYTACASPRVWPEEYRFHFNNLTDMELIEDWIWRDVTVT